MKSALDMDRTPASTVMAMQIALGTIPFGTAVNERDTFAILDRFVEAGGTMLDTADNYPFWVEGCTGDESEAAIGAWLAARDNRDQVFLSTKVGARPSSPATGRWTGPRACRPPPSTRPSRAACGDWGPTTSTSTGRTSRTARSPWRRPWEPRRAGPEGQDPRAARATCPPGAWSGPGTSRPRTAGSPTPTCSYATPTCARARTPGRRREATRSPPTTTWSTYASTT